MSRRKMRLGRCFNCFGKVSSGGDRHQSSDGVMLCRKPGIYGERRRSKKLALRATAREAKGDYIDPRGAVVKGISKRHDGKKKKKDKPAAKPAPRGAKK